jgi:hypothetical protein
MLKVGTKIYYARWWFGKNPLQIDTATIKKVTKKMYILDGEIEYCGRLPHDDKRISTSKKDAVTKLVRKLENSRDALLARVKDNAEALTFLEFWIKEN